LHQLIHICRFIDVTSTSDLFRLLGDPVRLRLLRVLSAESMNVSELTTVLGIAQSGVSRHLGLLRDAGLVIEDRTGGYTWYRLATEAGSVKGTRASLWAWLRDEFTRPGPAGVADDARLQEVRRLRKESFLAHGTETRRGQLVPGRSWAAWSRALGLLLPPVDVVDVGCGEGYLAIEAAQWARRVIAIDRAPDVLTRARALAARRKVTNIAWKRGELERVPLKDESADVVLLSQALHHAADPPRALAEAFRVLRRGGRLLVLDLREHDQPWVKRKLGDIWLGFSPDTLGGLLRHTGFSDVVVRVGARTTGDPFVVLVAAGTRPVRKKAAAATPLSRQHHRSIPRR
jgi:ArsR family transcriptional regulator